jgi:hypothetical protein
MTGKDKMKVDAPLFSMSAHGNIARSLCFRHRRGGPTACRAYVPAYRHTSKQNNNRSIFALGVAKAKLLTDEQKAALGRLAPAYKNNPPNNIYLSLFLNSARLKGKYGAKKYGTFQYGDPANFVV